jgi:hypothetical protein
MASKVNSTSGRSPKTNVATHRNTKAASKSQTKTGINDENQTTKNETNSNQNRQTPKETTSRTQAGRRTTESSSHPGRGEYEETQSRLGRSQTRRGQPHLSEEQQSLDAGRMGPHQSGRQGSPSLWGQEEQQGFGDISSNHSEEFNPQTGQRQQSEETKGQNQKSRQHNRRKKSEQGDE